MSWRADSQTAATSGGVAGESARRRRVLPAISASSPRQPEAAAAGIQTGRRFTAARTWSGSVSSDRRILSDAAERITASLRVPGEAKAIDRVRRLNARVRWERLGWWK